MPKSNTVLLAFSFACAIAITQASPALATPDPVALARWIAGARIAAKVCAGLIMRPSSYQFMRAAMLEALGENSQVVETLIESHYAAIFGQWRAQGAKRFCAKKLTEPDDPDKFTFVIRKGHCTDCTVNTTNALSAATILVRAIHAPHICPNLTLPSHSYLRLNSLVMLASGELESVAKVAMDGAMNANADENDDGDKAATAAYCQKILETMGPNSAISVLQTKPAN